MTDNTRELLIQKLTLLITGIRTRNLGDGATSVANFETWLQSLIDKEEKRYSWEVVLQYANETWEILNKHLKNEAKSK